MTFNSDIDCVVDKIIEDAKLRNDFNGSVKAVAVRKSPSFDGLIKCLRDIEIVYNPDYPKDGDEQDFSKVLDVVVEHEMVHKQDGRGRGCPKTDLFDLENVLVPMSDVLKKKGIPNVPFGCQGHSVYSFFANMFEDFVVNNVGCENRGSEGFFLLYDDFASSGFNDLFEAFIKLQAMTFPEKKGVTKMFKHFKHSKIVNEVYKNYLKKTELMSLDKKDRVGYLSVPENWKFLSEVFADEFSKLIDVKDLDKSWFPLFGGNDFKKLDDEDVQMDVVIKAYDASDEEFVPPAFMDDNFALLSLYKRLAKNIDIKAESNSVETKRPVAFVSRRKFDFDKDSLDRSVYGFNSRGKLELQAGKYPINVSSRYQVSAGHFPEVRIGLFDCSGSTKESVSGEVGKVMNPWASESMQWTDTSIYHSELMCIFGLWELFRRKGVLKNSNIRLGSFSGSTRIAKDLSESERLVLEPEFGGTSIKKSYLDDFFAGRDSLLYTISDGDISNWGSIKDKFIEGANKHQYFHLQIGKKNQMYEDLEKAGLTVLLDDGRNSAKILIDLTLKQVYGVSK